MRLIVFITAIFFGTSAFAVTYKYNELMIKDYDEMLAMVQGFVKKAKKSEGDDAEAIEHLRDAMKLILSRPDSDNMVSKLIPEIRRDLVGMNAFEDSYSTVVTDAISMMKNDKAAPSAQSTSLFILENALSQIQPEIGSNQEMRRIAEKIRDAKIHISDDLLKERKRIGMFKTTNPSERAQELLKIVEKQEKERAKQQKKQAEEDKKNAEKNKGKKVLSDE